MPTRQSPASKAGESAIMVRLSRDLLNRIDRWIASQDRPVSRSEAVRGLAEFALDSVGADSRAGDPNRGAEKAAGMASDMIDYLADQSATREDRRQRKTRLVKGPSEFREMRKKHDDARRKK